MSTNKVVPLTNSDQIAEMVVSGQSDLTHSTGWSGGETKSADDGKRSDFSLVLHCTKCDVNTSGMYEHIDAKERRCPSCHSLLMYCPSCKHLTSATEKFSVLTCDRCGTDFVTNTTIEYLSSRDRSSRDIVLSGVRAVGPMHLGNYFGAISQFVEYQRGDNLCMYFVADWHTLTNYGDSKNISSNVIGMATDYLAAGLNPERSVIYAQSSVPEIAEIALYLSMIQAKNRLEDLPTVKSIVRRGGVMSMGHLYYPVLMAADILGTKATVVPVGSDQVPNIELARELGNKFNEMFGHVFTIPRAGPRLIRVPGLSGRKMDESDETPSIFLNDDVGTIRSKYLKFGVTDAGRTKKDARGNPDACVSVYPVYKLIHESDRNRLGTVEEGCRSGKRGCVECKLELAGEIDALIAPFRERRSELAKQDKYVREVLHFGGIKAREIIRHTLEEMREKIGIVSV